MTFSPKHILLPVALEQEDDFALAMQALESACDIAAQFKSQITLLFVVPPAKIQSEYYAFNSDVYKAFSTLLKSRLDYGQELLSQLEKKAIERKIKVHVKILETEQNTALAICETATQKTMDLIVIGSHARRGIKRILLGSVANHVCQMASVPVLLLRYSSEIESA